MDEKVQKKRSKFDRNKDKDMPLNDGMDLGHSIEVEPNREKKKKHKDKKKKCKTDKMFNSNEVAQEDSTGISAKGQRCTVEQDFTFKRNEEEENEKSKRKKKERNNNDDQGNPIKKKKKLSNKSKRTEDSEFKSHGGDPVLDESIEVEPNREKKKKHKDKKKKCKTDKMFNSNEVAQEDSTGISAKGQRCTIEQDFTFKRNEEEENEKSKRKRKKERNNNDDQGNPIKKKKKLSNKSKRTEDSEFKSHGGDPVLDESNEGDLNFVGINIRDASAHSIATEVDDQCMKKKEKKKKKKKKSKEDKCDSGGKVCDSMEDANNSPHLAPEGASKRVTFSDHVEVFSDDLVRGKRYTPEEDEKIKEAVYNYIESHGLGDEGLDMVLNCKYHSKVKNCWKEIALALPHRPRESIYNRAHCLFERDESHKWTPEEYEMILKYTEKHGSNWKTLADAMGKHRYHVKDTWRRIKFGNKNKGRWTQEEYQKLFDLVNTDLRLRALEDCRKLKHGMLRDNICWEAIGEKLETRTSQECCVKWYDQLTSPMVIDGGWTDADDYRLINALITIDACCTEEVDWDNLLEERAGDACRKRWKQMVRHLREHANKSFAEQVEILSKRYSPELLEAREAFDNLPVVP